MTQEAIHKITIYDIARQAGVSKTTVSRVLNHKPDVDPITRDRILRLMEELGYVPSIAATGLAGGRGRLIGVLVPAFTWPLIPEIMRGVADIIDTTDYELVLYSVNSGNHEKDRSDIIDRVLATKLVTGVVAMYPGQSAKHLATLHKQGFPVVMLDDQDIPPADVPWVGADQRVGAYEATWHLIRQGHTRIAHLQGPLKYRVSLDRYQGYCQALREAGIALNPDLVVQGDFMPTGGKDAATRLFTLAQDKRPTAIFASSDLMAFGIYTGAEQFGLRVPEDVAVVGFDDITLASHLQPTLTTVRQPLYEMGRRAIKLLLRIVDAQGTNRIFTHTRDYLTNTSSPLHITLATSLVVRSSSGDRANAENMQDYQDSTVAH